MKTIEIRIDTDRMNTVVSVDDYIALEDKTIKGVRNVVSHFVVDKNGGYMPHDKAMKLIGALNLEQLMKLGDDFVKGSEAAAGADPKVSQESTQPTSPD